MAEAFPSGLIPAFEPETGIPYKVLYERQRAAYLDLLRAIRDLLDEPNRQPHVSP